MKLKDLKEMKVNIAKLSPSSITLYQESQFRFYLKYILRLPSQNEVVQCYGKAGTLVHELLEKPEDISMVQFKEVWDKSGLNELKDLRDRVLNIDDYYDMYLRGYKVLEANNFNFYPEEEIQIELDGCTAKGIIDVLSKDRNCILDWKTCTKIKEYKLQATHYAWSVYKKYNIIPKVVFYFLRQGKQVPYNITLKDIQEYTEFLNNLSKEINSKKEFTDFNLGEDSIFNEYKELYNEYKELKELKELK